MSGSQKFLINSEFPCRQNNKLTPAKQVVAGRKTPLEQVNKNITLDYTPEDE